LRLPETPSGIRHSPRQKLRNHPELFCGVDAVREYRNAILKAIAATSINLVLLRVPKSASYTERHFKKCLDQHPPTGMRRR
jgi:hypothetical protein